MCVCAQPLKKKKTTHTHTAASVFNRENVNYVEVRGVTKGENKKNDTDRWSPKRERTHTPKKKNDLSSKKKKGLWSNFISAVVFGHNRRNAQRTRSCEKRESGYQRNMRVVLARIRSFLFFFIIISEGAFTLLNAQKEQRRKLKKATRKRLNSGERGKKKHSVKGRGTKQQQHTRVFVFAQKSGFLIFFFFFNERAPAALRSERSLVS